MALVPTGDIPKGQQGLVTTGVGRRWEQVQWDCPRGAIWGSVGMMGAGAIPSAHPALGTNLVHPSWAG